MANRRWIDDGTLRRMTYSLRRVLKLHQALPEELYEVMKNERVQRDLANACFGMNVVLSSQLQPATDEWAGLSLEDMTKKMSFPRYRYCEERNFPRHRNFAVGQVAWLQLSRSRSIREVIRSLRFRQYRPLTVHETLLQIQQEPGLLDKLTMGGVYIIGSRWRVPEHESGLDAGCLAVPVLEYSRPPLDAKQLECGHIPVYSIVPAHVLK